MKFGLCYGCLTKGHLSATCTQRKNCRLCKGRHPTSLHRNDLGKRDEGVVSLHACPTLVAVEGSNLHVVPLLVTLGQRTVKTNAFLDSGSTHSFCSRKLLTQLNYEPEESTEMLLTTVRGRSRLPSHVIRGMVAKDLKENNCLTLPPLLTLHKIPVEHNDIQTSSKDIKYLLDKGVEVAHINGDVDLLLGSNAASAMEPLQVVNSENGGPFAIQTRFGWVISGTGNAKSPNVNSMLISSEWDEVNNERGHNERKIGNGGKGAFR